MVSDDWKAFVREIAEVFNKGATEQELATSYRGSRVRWNGQVEAVQLDDEVAPGVRMIMPRVVSRLDDGRFLRADYVYVGVGATGKKSWGAIVPGQKVVFEAEIEDSGGIFSPVIIDTFEGDPECVLQVSLEEGKCVG